MKTTKYELYENLGWQAVTNGATQVLVQIRTSGNVELVIAETEPPLSAMQGVVLTSGSRSVFQLEGMEATDIVWLRILDGHSEPDTVIVLDNGSELE